MLHIFLSNRPATCDTAPPASRCRATTSGSWATTATPVERRARWANCRCAGPTSAVMYWNNREQSRATFLGEWTRSGDKYIEDEDGYFVYCGRRDDMLKVGGIYVSPFEVEARAARHPDVLEAAVVAGPTPTRLIKPKAFVVLKSPDTAGEALARALQDHCREKLAPYKYPRWIEFRAELPKTATGKIQRFKLRAEAPAH